MNGKQIKRTTSATVVARNCGKKSKGNILIFEKKDYNVIRVPYNIIILIIIICSYINLSFFHCYLLTIN